MKQLLVAMFLIVSSVFLPKIGQCSKTIPNVPDWEESEYKKRQPIIHEATRRLEIISREVHRPEIGNVVEFLRSESEIIVPRNNNGAIDVAKTKKQSENVRVGILVFLPEDKGLNKEWDELIENTRGAVPFCMPGKRPVIFFRRTTLNRPWEEINLLRAGIIAAEANEIRATFYNNIPRVWSLERARIEDSVWGIIPEVMKALKGPEYQSVVEAEKKRLRSQNNFLRPPPMTYSRILNILFGDPLSPFEEDFRETVLWISAVMEVIDENNPDPLKAQEERVQFLYRALQKNQM